MCLIKGNLLRDRYKIIQELGRGGWGVTYLAEDLENSSNLKCVVKEIKGSHELTEAENETYFNREVSALKVLGRHNQIPSYIDSFIQNNKYYIIQEFISGNLLSQQIQTRTRLRERKVKELLIDILEVLEFIHQHNTIHRDIKPSNIIRRDDGEIIIIDYGTVKEIGTLSYTTSGNLESILIGSQPYIAPERYMFPKPNGIDNHPRVDIYSVGMIGLQAITGLAPQELYIDRISGERFWSEAIKISPQMKSVLNKMSHTDPHSRYQSVDEALRDLKAIYYSQFTTKIIDDSNSSIFSRGLKIGSLQINYESLIVAFSLALLLVFWKIGLESSRSPSEQNQNNTLNLSSVTLLSPEDKTNIKSDAGISIGEEIINVDTRQYTLKRQAVEYYSQGNYEAAIQKFKEYWNRGNQDPETLIYLNNALIELTEEDYKTLAVVVPFTDNNSEKANNLNDIANELLRGIAKAQEEVNLGLLSNNLLSNNQLPDVEILKQRILQGQRFKIIIASDENNQQKAKQVANKLVKIKSVVGVVGHYTSDVTIQALDIYNQAKIPLISPTSSSEELISSENSNPFFFRTIPTVEANAEVLANYLINKVKLKKVAIFYNHDPESFSYSFWREFKNRVKAKGGEIIIEYDNFNQNNFGNKKAIKTIEKEAEIAIVLLPGGQVTNSLNNAKEIIKLNAGHNWILGSETLYNPETLNIGSSQLFDKFAIAIPWHSSTSPNLIFVKESEKLWQGSINYRTALAYDATRAFIKAIQLAQEKPIKITPTGIQSILSQDNFTTQGASGTIEFTPQGNRKSYNIELVTIIDCQHQVFVPLERKQCLN
ncbi:MAG: bifunctional serine/threonine-protein kinase/ABC transporter substrate-binding protein [Xenococcaceae cyanobacterium MO_167.B27]|nr:bifunctional serine/threonine-protein kinase/ABC transporter substrate-binding protein [Xenococcaceae cyanobacterium MO_167.B27]